MKHTQGPWTAEPSVKGGYNIRDTDGNVPGIARTYGRYGAEEDEANARLIAAAPEMYKALRRFVDIISERKLQATQEDAPLALLHCDAMALLAKAKGE